MVFLDWLALGIKLIPRAKQSKIKTMKKSIVIIVIGFITLMLPTIASAQKSKKIMWPVLQRNYIEVTLVSETNNRNEWKLCNKEFYVISCCRKKNPNQKESKYIHVFTLQAKKMGIHNLTFQKVDSCTAQIIKSGKIIVPII